tara:strand:- start:9 stop:986 length:978 start_codon:yes stop_codon:yes gene_type:complete
MDDFILGTIEATKELGQPFVSESIWTEAITDIFFRGGRSRSGSRVWNPDDTPGTKISKSIGHLVEAQMPLSAKQFGRLKLAFKNKGEPVGVVTKGKFNEYGETYELGDEALGFIGARAIPINPEKSIKFKIADFQKGVSNSRQLFTTELLKGGPVEPKAIIDAYINANRALFNNNKKFYKVLEASKVLGADQDKIASKVIDRVGRPTYGSVNEGIFRPLNISDKVMQAFAENAEKLGLPNPFIEAAPILGEIKAKLFEVPLTEEGIPEFINPFDNLPDPTLGPVSELPPLVTGTNPTVIAANQKLVPGNFNNLTQAQKYELLFRD